MPYWSVALAYLVDGRAEVAVTYDPVHDELFWARRGTGAYRDERAIRASDRADPKQAVIGSTFTFKMAIEDYVRLVEGILRAGADHRRMGSTALMMCHVADGRLDGCATLYCNSWDVIGGLLLVQEAGGAASDFLAGASLDRAQPRLRLRARPDRDGRGADRDQGPRLTGRARAPYRPPTTRRSSRAISWSSSARSIASSRGAGRPQRRAGEHAAAVQDLLADREADARLLLVADQRQIGVVEVEGGLLAPGGEALVDLDQDLRIGEAGHRAVGAAAELERVVEPAVADQDRDPPAAVARGPGAQRARACRAPGSPRASGP